MTLVENITQTVEKLPVTMQAEILDFVEFLKFKMLMQKNNEKDGRSRFSLKQALHEIEKETENLTQHIMKLTSNSKSFEFLHDEDDLYDESDLIEKF